jgi:CDP-diacylglycerol--glycerol-3-phosphate 3-phosphatidyltransferase
LLEVISLRRDQKIKIIFLPEGLKDWFLNLITPITEFFIKREVNPNFFTTVGLILSAVAAYILGLGHLHWGGAMILIAGLFDILDGRVARATNRVTKFGALYDSTLDRYGEVLIFFGLAYYFSRSEIMLWGFDWSTLVILSVSMALGGSVMTSYVRARAEGLGLECSVGIMQRSDRLVYLGFGALFIKFTLVLALILIAIMANITAIQRLYHVWKTENK